MSFSLVEPEAVTPFDGSDSHGLREAVRQIGEIGGAVLGNLPDEMRFRPDEDPKMWAQRASGLLAPIIEEVYPGLISPNYGVEGRRQVHHREHHFGVHQDPRYRDTVFFGGTDEGAEAEFRFGVRLDKPSHTFQAAPGTMWMLGGSSLFTPEDTGGKKGGIWHEIGAPRGDRHVAIGSFRRPRAA
jgi:hypothetical protein